MSVAYLASSYLMTFTGHPTADSMIFSDSSPQVAWPSTWTTLVVSVTWKTVGAVSSQRSQTMQPGMIQTFVTVPVSPVGASMPAMPDSTPGVAVAVAAGA